MTPFIQVFTFATSLGVVAMNIATLFLVYAFIVNKARKGNESSTILTWISTHAFIILLLTSMLSIGGSYFYSLIAGFAPCKLCWFQRTFFYGLLILYVIGWLKRDSRGEMEKGVFVCSFILSLFSLAVSTFQYYGSMFNPGILAACEANGVSCSKNYFVYFGYINIPMMALSAFSLLAVVAFIRITYNPRLNK